MTKDHEARAAAEELRQRLEEALASGEALNSADMSNLIAELAAVQETAIGVSSAFQAAFSALVQLQGQASRAVALANARIRFAGDPEGLAGAEFDITQPRLVEGVDGPDGAVAAYNRTRDAVRELTVEEVRLNEVYRERARGGGGGGRRGGRGGGGGGESQANKDRKEALSLIERMRTAEERRTAELEKYNELRERLVAIYGEEDEVVKQLDVSIRRLNSEQLNFAKELAKDLLLAIARGEDLDEVLNNIFNRILEASISGILDNLFNILAGGGQARSGGGGGGLLGFIGRIFGFAEGGVMTKDGPLPLRKYASGGIADSPQVAVFGEGSSPEAFVPLPDGRSIPVRFPDIERLTQASQPVAQSKVITLAPVYDISIDGGSERSNDDLLREMRTELEQRDLQLLNRVRELNETDPNFLV